MDRFVSKEIFEEKLKERLTEEQYKRALKMFQVYGPYLSWDITNIF